ATTTSSDAEGGGDGGDTTLVGPYGTGGAGGADDTLVGAPGGSTSAASLAPATGGSSNASSNSTGGSGLSSSSPTMNCGHVTRPAIPSICTKFVQPDGECCPKCAYNPCEACEVLTCAVGRHLQTLAGDCCPSCVVDPPSACEKGLANYARDREMMVDKYSTSGCTHRSDCTIVAESNLCAWTCGIPLPLDGVRFLNDNLLSRADATCSSCSQPPPILCEQAVPACVNGKCVAASPQ
ncbi:MAG TPA: hypothetical protein VIV60_20085, partial [Polyangiaceae bacterium]